MAHCYSKRITSFLASIADIRSRDISTFSKFVEALSIYRKRFSARFKNGESVDVCFGLNVDPKKPDQMIRGSCVLPHGNGISAKVAVFGDVDVVSQALEVGANLAGGVELVEDILSGKYVCGRDFNVCLATPGMMVNLSKIAKILGPRGLMPNIKLGTVSDNIIPVLREALCGRAQFKTDKDGFIRMSLARLNTDTTGEQISENLLAVYNAIKLLKPASIKAHYFSSVKLSTTMMGCSFDVKVQELL